MTIDGQPVVEIDVRASYLTILHALKGVPFHPGADDPYNLPGIPRSAAKKWTVATMGSPVFIRTWPQVMRWELEEELAETGQPVPTPRAVKDAMLAKHPVLRTWDTDSITWADLQFIESNALVAAMLEMKAAGHPSLGVHDSLIVQAAEAQMAMRILEHTYEEASGAVPHLTVSSRVPTAHVGT